MTALSGLSGRRRSHPPGPAPAAGAPQPARAVRKEIQALRALAVSGVVLYHLWPAALPGGFVGVDVFFVISGLLITRHLVDELDGSGRISLTGFWAARIRRILPAALTVLLASLAILVLAMPQVTWQNNLSDIRAAAVFVENWQLGVHAVDYLAGENSPSLVQHYWSLSVEEQFYLVWPVLLLLTAAGRPSPRRRRLLLVLGGVTAVSLLVSVVLTAASPSMAFFATPARAWEFGIGGLLAVLLPRLAPLLHRGGRAVLSWLGLALLAWSVLLISSDAAFPGAIALLPVSGAALVLTAGLPAGVVWSPARLLAARPVQWLGDNSYSTYLWHWPLLIGAPWLLHRPLHAYDRIAVLGASLVLAALTKRLVEDPVRRGVRWRSHRSIPYGLAAAGVATLLTLSSSITADVQKAEVAARSDTARQTRTLVESPGQRSCFGAAAMDPGNRCADPYTRPKHLDLTFAAADGRKDPCLQSFDAASPDWCTLGRTAKPTRTIAVVGNSHAWRLVPALVLYGQQHGWKILVATRIDCLGLTATSPGGSGPSANCLSWSAAVRRQLLSMPHLDAVVFPSYRFAEDFTAGRAATPSQVQDVRTQVLELWRAFARHGTHVVVPEDVPGMRPTQDPECLAETRTSDDPCAVARQSVVRPNLTTRLAAQNPDLASAMPLTSYFCDAAKCHAVIGGVVVYFDAHHLTTTYSRSMARYVGAALTDVLAGPVRPAG